MRGPQDPSPHPGTPKTFKKILKIQYFLPRTLLKPPATFPELSGSARERSGAAQKVPGGPSGASAPARAESGRPQNWSPAISGNPKPLKINEKSIFSAQNTSKTSCNLPRALWKRHRASWSRPNAPTQLPNYLVNKWQTPERDGGIAALLRFG